jgi:hypothetical protein
MVRPCRTNSTFAALFPVNVEFVMSGEPLPTSRAGSTARSIAASSVGSA